MKYIFFYLIPFFALKAQRLEKIYTKGEYIFSVVTYKNGIKNGIVFLEKKEGDYKQSKSIAIGKFEEERKVEFIGLEVTGRILKNKQEMIHWNYYDANFNRLSQETTGMIQNANRIWLHSPRSQFFRILELNPFPEIRYQESFWNTELEVGDSWADRRWKIWEGELFVNSKYHLNSITNEIIAEADTGIGPTQLIVEFDRIFGFKKLDFRTIEGSHILMQFLNFTRQKE